MKNINVRIINSILFFYDAHSEDIKFVNNHITGKAIFNDESGTQDFVLKAPNFKYPEIVDVILSFLINNNLYNGDKITIPLVDLINEIASLHNSYNDVKSAIEEIQDIKIFMLEDGKETDYFFIHF